MVKGSWSTAADGKSYPMVRRRTELPAGTVVNVVRSDGQVYYAEIIDVKEIKKDGILYNCKPAKRLAEADGVATEKNGAEYLFGGKFYTKVEYEDLLASGNLTINSKSTGNLMATVNPTEDLVSDTALVL